MIFSPVNCSEKMSPYEGSGDIEQEGTEAAMLLNEVGIGRMAGMEAAQLLPLFYLVGLIKRGRSGS
jgi:hypothetical protein